MVKYDFKTLLEDNTLTDQKMTHRTFQVTLNQTLKAQH